MTKRKPAVQLQGFFPTECVTTMTKEVACPFVYANGRRCTGHITRIEGYKADVTWIPDAKGKWRPSVGEPRSYYHLFCSEKETHATTASSDHPQMMKRYRELPAGIKLEFE